MEPEDWDETRLRALCARHGWQFEWMTEEGEKRRRIEGAGRAKRAAEKAAKKQAESGGGEAAWWRLDSVVKAFAFGQQEKKIQPPSKPKRMEQVTQAGAVPRLKALRRSRSKDPQVAKLKTDDVKLETRLR